MGRWPGPMKRGARRLSSRLGVLFGLEEVRENAIAARRAAALALLTAQQTSGPTEHDLWSPSRLCTAAEMLGPAFLDYRRRTGPTVLFNRKHWEWHYIDQALDAAGMLRPGMRGIGFGVGVEPLTASFAARGVSVLATDLDPTDERSTVWQATNQHIARRLSRLNEAGLCPADEFSALVAYRDVDMTTIPEDLSDFDFAWSSCSLEHLGSLEAGLAFVVAAVDTVRSGGVMVHTTEFNVSSDDDTYDDFPTCLYRRRDIESLADRLAAVGARLLPVDFSTGDLPIDHYVDVPPFLDEPFLKLKLGRFVTTSIGFVVQKDG